MPVEIKELHIKVNVNQPGNGQSASPRPSGGAAPAAGGSQTSNGDLVAECVEQVLNILRQRGER